MYESEILMDILKLKNELIEQRKIKFKGNI